MKKFVATFDTVSQFVLPILTMLAQLAYAFKYPAWGMLITLLLQPFWIFSAYQSYKKAGQKGLFITALLYCAITVWGFINYWMR